MKHLRIVSKSRDRGDIDFKCERRGVLVSEVRETNRSQTRSAFADEGKGILWSEHLQLAGGRDSASYSLQKTLPQRRQWCFLPLVELS